ncbi:hypothetical protein BRDID11002_40680 [Bradyrhizobium diazoefficiens]
MIERFALDARHRRFTKSIRVGEIVDDGLAKTVLVVEHVMGNAELGGNVAGVVDVLAGAAGALAMGRRAMVVELERDADDVVALSLEQRSRRRGIDAARHGDDDPGVLRTAFEIQTVEHGFLRCDGGVRRSAMCLWPGHRWSRGTSVPAGARLARSKAAESDLFNIGGIPVKQSQGRPA